MFTVSSYVVHWMFIYYHMYSDVQMSFRKSERSIQTRNNKISGDWCSIGLFYMLYFLMLYSYICYKHLYIIYCRYTVQYSI